MNPAFDYAASMIDGVEQRMEAQRRLFSAFARAVERVGMPRAMAAAATYVALDPAGRIVPPEHVEAYIAALDALQPIMANGLTEAETAATASCAGLTTECAAQAPIPDSAVETPEFEPPVAALPDPFAGLADLLAAIEDKMVGGDWEEIEEARTIANAAIATLTAEMERPAIVGSSVILENDYIDALDRIRVLTTALQDCVTAMTAVHCGSVSRQAIVEAARAALGGAERPAPEPVAWISETHAPVVCWMRPADIDGCYPVVTFDADEAREWASQGRRVTPLSRAG